MRNRVGISAVPHLIVVLLLAAYAFAADGSGMANSAKSPSLTKQSAYNASPSGAAFHAVPYSPQQDMAIVSVLGSKTSRSLKGCQRAVLYNAQGAILKEVDISRSDSLYVLDKIIQANRIRGPLFIKLIR
jgi:hypothetical protein